MWGCMNLSGFSDLMFLGNNCDSEAELGNGCQARDGEKFLTNHMIRNYKPELVLITG
jgi:hypothetical protein